MSLADERWRRYQTAGIKLCWARPPASRSFAGSIRLLFIGPSGTRKTMTAEVISREWGWDLKRIHLNPLVNKHIDETERNLEQVSSAEGSSRVVLLFDEADALFRERTEVKDSHDRLTNVEVSHHSQRLEDYRDLVILTTNQSEYIDEAFLGRLAQPHSRRKSTLNMYTYM